MEDSGDGDSAPCSITEYLQGVIRHNSRLLGKVWPTEEQLTVATQPTMTSSKQLPLSSPVNVQPSPKDSGVDLSSPARHLDSDQPPHQDSEAERLDDVCASREFGPSSVESGMITEQEGQDESNNGHGLSAEVTKGQELSAKSTENCAEVAQNAGTESREEADKDVSKCHELMRSISEEENLLKMEFRIVNVPHGSLCDSSGGESPAPSPAVFSRTSPHHQKSPSHDHSATPTSCASSSVDVHSSGAALQNNSQESGSIFYEQSTSSNLVSQCNTTVSMFNECEPALTSCRSTANNSSDTPAPTRQILHENVNSESKPLTDLAAADATENTHDGGELCVTPSRRRLRSSSHQLRSDLRSCANVPADSEPTLNDVTTVEPVLNKVSVPQNKKTAVKRKHSHSVSGMLMDEESLLPVIKLRRVSPGKYRSLPTQSMTQTTSQSSTQSMTQSTIQSPKQPTLKIKYGSAENGDKAEVVTVPFHRSVSDPVISHSAPCGTWSQPPQSDPYDLVSEEEEDSVFVEPPWVSRVLRQTSCSLKSTSSLSNSLMSPDSAATPTPEKPAMPAKLEDRPKKKRHKTSRVSKKAFNVKKFEAAHQKVVNLRRKVLRLFKLLFPGLVFPRWLGRVGPHVDCLVEQVYGVLSGEASSQVVLPVPGTCCAQVNVTMCSSPAACLKSLRRKIYKLVQKLLPDVDLKGIDRNRSIVEKLLQKVYTANKRALRDGTGT